MTIENEIWSFPDFYELVEGMPLDWTGRTEGFTFLSPENLLRYTDLTDEYAFHHDPGPFQRQDLMGLPNDLYHRVIASFDDETLAGAMLCTWTNEGMPLWRYELSFIDVRHDRQGEGIGTQMTQTLHEASFLDNRILHITGYSDKGRERIKNVFERELSGGRYVVMFPEEDVPLELLGKDYSHARSGITLS